MNKEQSADDPPWIWSKICLIAPFLKASYLDVVIACIEHMSLKHSEQLRQRWWSTIIIWRIIPGGWLITITANHSNYLVCDRANTQSVTVRKVVKLQLNYCNALAIREFTISSCSEGRTRDVHSSSLLIRCICSSDVSLRRQASMTQAEKFPDLFCSRAMLICSIIWLGKRMLRVVGLRFCSSLTWGCPVFSVADLYCLEVVFTLSWCRSINTIPAS